MKPVYALYPDGYAAQRAVDSLRAAGVSDDEITVITSAPLEDFEFAHIGSKNRLWSIASFGGLAGLLSAAWLTWFTERDWPINVGNMAIVPWYANLIVVFELTMLGAILATVAALVITSGLLRRRPALYDPEVSNGKILVGLENPTLSDADIERALALESGITLKTVEQT
jgi:hypothetical protein